VKVRIANIFNLIIVFSLEQSNSEMNINSDSNLEFNRPDDGICEEAEKAQKKKVK